MPLGALYATSRSFSLGDRSLRWLRLHADDCDDAPVWRRSVSDWTDEGLAKATRVGQRYGFASETGVDVTGRVVDLAVSFVLVKLLLPVRLYASVALAPSLARRMSSGIASALGRRAAAKL